MLNAIVSRTIRIQIFGIEIGAARSTASHAEDQRKNGYDNTSQRMSPRCRLLRLYVQYLSSSSTENKKVACKKGEENSPIISKPGRHLIRTPQTTAEFLPHSAQIKGVLCSKAGSDQHFHVGGVRRFTLLQPQSAQVETIQCLTQSWELPNHPNSKFWNRHWNRTINVFL